MGAPIQAPVASVARGAAKARGVGDAVVSKAPDAARAAGFAAAGLAGGLVLGARLAPRRGALAFHRRKVLGMPVGRKPATLAAAHALVGGVRRAAAAGGRVSATADDLHEVREQLEQLNRRSPVEVLLDGLTHRRGAHRREG